MKWCVHVLIDEPNVTNTICADCDCSFFAQSTDTCMRSKELCSVVRVDHQTNELSLKRLRLIFSRLLALAALSSHLISKHFILIDRNIIDLFQTIAINTFLHWKMLLFLGVFLVTTLVYILRFHYELVHAFYLSLKISGPPALPIIGNGLLFLNNTSAGIVNIWNYTPNFVWKNKQFLLIHFNRKFRCNRQINQTIWWFYSSVAWPGIEYCYLRSRRCWGEP